MNDTQAACAALTRTGDALTIAATHQLRIINLSDGWPTKGNNPGRSNDTTSTTERAAIATVDGDHEATQARAVIEDIRDWWTGLRIMLADGARLAARYTPVDRQTATLCDGRPFEGSEAAWVPHSRSDQNGWHDPLCVDVADESGLCVRCKVRERRWRAAHGMRPRNRNRFEDAA